MIGELDYSNVTVQKDLEDILTKIEQSPFFGDSILTESWLRDFLQFNEVRSLFEDVGNTSTEVGFVRELRTVSKQSFSIIVHLMSALEN